MESKDLPITCSDLIYQVLLLFLIYINVLHDLAQFISLQTNLLISNKSIKTIQTQINHDLKCLFIFGHITNNVQEKPGDKLKPMGYKN